MSAPGETLVEPRPEGGGGARVLRGRRAGEAMRGWCKEADMSAPGKTRSRARSKRHKEPET